MTMDSVKDNSGSHYQIGTHCKYGKRLLPQVLDQWAAEDPDYIAGMIAKSVPTPNPSKPIAFDQLSVSQLAHVVNWTSYWLDDILNPKTTDFPKTIAFFGLQDFRYWAMYYGSMKTGRRLLLPNPRNAPSNTLSLLRSTDCKTIFYTGHLASQAEELQRKMPGLQIIPIPCITAILASKTEHYPYDKTFEEAQNEVVLILHTSGSTGDPKPIPYTNERLNRGDCDALTPPVDGRVLANLSLCTPGSNILMGTNFFHLSGIALSVSSHFNRFTTVWGPADQLPSGQIVYDILRSVSINGIVVVPSICDAVFSKYGRELVPYLTELQHICWLGGPLAQSTGDWIITNFPATILWQIFGSTETGLLPMLVPARSHWQYMEFHPVIGPSLEPISDPELFEVVLRRLPDPELAWSRMIFTLFPGMTEWRSRDLMRRCQDPGFENLWKYEGRVDDMMLLSNGLKVNPLHMESQLVANPLLKGALVFGDGYTGCGLLLEPQHTETTEQLPGSVWEVIDRANGLLPEHARVSKKQVVVADFARPFVRASKGTVIRKKTLALYQEDIQRVYGIEVSVNIP